MSHTFGRRSRSHRLRVERLESRVQPSAAGVLPPSHFLVNEALTAADHRAGSPRDIALTYLNDHAGQLGLTPADLASARVTGQYTDADTGMTHLYLRQTVRGLEVLNADLNVHVTADGAVFSVAGGFVPGLSGLVTPTSSALSPVEAVRSAATELGLPLEEDPVEVNPVYGPAKTYTIAAPSVSIDEITARLHYVPNADGGAVLAWGLVIQTTDGQHWYDLSVAAEGGGIVALADWVDADSYNVLPTPNDSPIDGGFQTLVNPADPTASPFGWHDTNGAAGAEFTDTRGNNVDAHLDRDADNAADANPPRPAGGAALDFSGYGFNAALAPATTQNMNAAVVNLFYMNNVLHDVHYKYGFTEAAGNFQANNYGKGGLANDALQADAQDGSGTNNANMGTPPDGSAPRMQMYTWTAATPDRDSDLDNGIIAHEYGHGVSNRLTGGPANSNALNATQSGGMGEGWSDFYALMFMQRPTDTINSAHGVGTYVLNEPITGDGIRRFRYSFNMATNPLTYDAYGTAGTTSYGVTRSTQVHNTGEIWCSTLWDLNWLLINKYGYDANLATGWSPNPGAANAGNKLTLRLVMEGMKLQPANPSFIQARDAIIAADIALNGGRDLFEIWTAFARRGLGFGASTVDSNATTVTGSFALPMVVAGVVPATGAVVTTAPASFTLNVSNAIDPATLQAGDLKVNGQAATGVSYTAGTTTASFTFGVNPVTAEGPQTVSIAAGAFNQASSGTAVAAFSSTFYLDASPLSVVSIAPAAPATLAPPFTTIDVNLNGAVNPASVQTSDLTLSRGSVTGVSLVNSDTTVRFTLANLTTEGSVSVSLAAGAFTDTAGSPSAAFAGGTFQLDFTTLPFPTPLTPRLPLGTLVYEGEGAANIGFAGDSDSFTLDLDAGQLLDLTVTPDAGLRPTVTVTGPGTNLTASATITGGLARLPLVPITTAGTYTFAVGGLISTVGNFSVGVLLNNTIEAEVDGVPPNDSTATAENLGAGFLALGAGLSRASVVGRTDVTAIPESEPNNVTAGADLVTAATAAPTNLYQMSFTGEISGTDADYFNIGTMQVGDVITITESGQWSGRGTLNDARIRLYRNNGGTAVQVATDDDGGPGQDSLVYRFTVTTADTYIARASRFTSTDAGTYAYNIFLENTSTAPATGGSFPAEIEPNNSATAPNNAANAWRAIPYAATVAGALTVGDTDLYAFQFTAGEVVSFVVRSTSGLTPQSAVLDPAGVELATEDGTSLIGGAGGISPVYAYVIPTTDTYYFRVTGASGSTGTYQADLYLSTAATLTVLPPGRDLYAFTLTAGQSASVALEGLTAGNVDLALLDGSGAVVAIGVAGPTNFDEIAANYTAPSSGVYFAQVSGPANIDYRATVVTGGTIDAEANDTFGTAQTLGASTAALGVISGNDDWYQFTAPAGSSITLSTLTPGGGPGEFPNALDPAIELYDPANVLIAGDDNSAGDGRNATLTKSAAVGGSYRVRVRGAAGTAGEYVLAGVVSSDPPPAVASPPVVNDGSPGRSRVTGLTVTFSEVVTLGSGAFQVARTGPGTPTGNVSVTVDTSASTPTQTVATLTFSGALSEGASLIDGLYTLTVFGAQVTDSGAQALAGGDFTFNLHRLFGDADGDRDVDTQDYGAFRPTFGATSFAFDFDNDGDVDAADYGQFRSRFGTSV